jgi:carbonic anhydrase
LVPLVCGFHIPNFDNPDFNQRASWGYTAANGPATWPATYSTCGGTSQSPIDIVSATASATNLQDFTMTNYDAVMSGSVTNNGHGLSFAFTDGTAPTVTGGRLGSDIFEFAQFHWHWGSVSTQGSEHTLDGKEYPAELHLVHFNKKYGTLGDAVSQADGLAVLGFFYEVSSTTNGNLTPFFDQVAALTNRKRSLDDGRSFAANFTAEAENRSFKDREGKKKKTAFRSSVDSPVSGTIKLTSMFPIGGLPGTYYYYYGSLTTPTCDESVQWTVFDKTVPISEAQLEMLRMLTSAGVTLNDNYRPPQALNGRTVSYRVAPPSSAELTAATVGALIAGVAAGAVAVLAMTGAFNAFIPARARQITESLLPANFNLDNLNENVVLRRLAHKYGLRG